MCLSIFSDFAIYHTEWANEKGTGWSPSYTAQVFKLLTLHSWREKSKNKEIEKDKEERSKYNHLFLFVLPSLFY